MHSNLVRAYGRLRPKLSDAIFHFDRIVFDWNDVSPGIGWDPFCTFGGSVCPHPIWQSAPLHMHMFQYTAYEIWAHRHRCVLCTRICAGTGWWCIGWFESNCVRGAVLRWRWISCELQTCGKYKMKLKAITLRVWRDVARMRTTINPIRCGVRALFLSFFSSPFSRISRSIAMEWIVQIPKCINSYEFTYISFHLRARLRIFSAGNFIPSRCLSSVVTSSVLLSLLCRVVFVCICTECLNHNL